MAAGSGLQVERLGQLGALGLAFIGARVAGKLLGSFIGIKLGGFGKELPSYLGLGLMCQAGVALGILNALEGSAIAEPITRDLRGVVLASVAWPRGGRGNGASMPAGLAIQTLRIAEIYRNWI